MSRHKYASVDHRTPGRADIKPSHLHALVNPTREQIEAGLDVRRREWARARMKQYRDAPIYGSPEWLALSDTDPAKVASVVRAAECWAIDGTRIAEQLRLELEFRASFEKQLDDAEYQQRAQAHRDRIRNTSWTPHPANRSGGGA